LEKNIKYILNSREIFLLFSMETLLYNEEKVFKGDEKNTIKEGYQHIFDHHFLQKVLSNFRKTKVTAKNF